MTRRTSLAVLAVVALAYPLAALSGGLPEFPSRGDCARPATDGDPIEAVLTRLPTEREALAARDRARRVGFAAAEIERDPCGSVKVVIRGIPSLEVGHELAKEAATVGFDVTLERTG
jgi:hypothetical protein